MIETTLPTKRKIKVEFKEGNQAKLLGYECQSSGTYAKRAKHATKIKINAAACLCFLNYLAFLRPEAVWAVSILP
jgi:hypothetical protein